MTDYKYFYGKKILITGHTGFKGTWLCDILTKLGADITGYALEPGYDNGLFEKVQKEKGFKSVIGDIRNLENLKKTFDEVKPEMVIHMAAQPLVRESYEKPVYTYETNVMGTVNVCECIRRSDTVLSFVNVTTDKVYKNLEFDRGYTEEDVLDGYDPYSNSKSCSELVTHSYTNSFFNDAGVAVSTARAGNVIGGGDFAKDRIVPDCVRAASKNEKIIVRNPYSIRPYQIVLEPLFAYLLIMKKQSEDKKYSGSYNIGPDDKDCITTGKLVDIFCNTWGEGSSWIDKSDGGPHEARFLKLDCHKAKNKLDWTPVWNIDMAIKKTVEWYKTFYNNEDFVKCMDRQIDEFISDKEKNNV